jgi:hypothetical protein
LTYLPWAHAVRILLEHYPAATWKHHKFDEFGETKNKVPYMKTKLGYFVRVTVTVEGIDRTETLPVLDYRNKPIDEPDTFQVNTSGKRCLTKAIALHGLGLYIYAGEDVPPALQPDFTSEAADEQADASPSLNDLLGECAKLGKIDGAIKWIQQQANDNSITKDNAADKIASKKLMATIIDGVQKSIVVAKSKESQ